MKKKKTEIKLPDSAIMPAWFSSPDTPLTQMSQEEFQARRERDTPFLRKHMSSMIKSERRISILLKQATKRSAKAHLKSALLTIREQIEHYRTRFIALGITLEDTPKPHSGRA